MMTGMGNRLRDYVEGTEPLTSSDPMKQYANSVMAIFVERCEDHELDPNRMWLRLRYAEETLRDMYHRNIGVPEAGDQLRYRAMHQLHTQSPERRV